MTALDAVTLEVIWNRMIASVDEAAKAIVRTSFSTLSNEANDFACVLTDVDGQLLAQNSGSIPSFIGTLPATVRHTLDRFGRDGLEPGDVICTNDPWLGTGHLNDCSIVRPIFRGDELIAFAATASHMPDIGGRIRSVEAREIFEEGFHIPLLKIFRAGVPDETFFELLRTQVRTPDQTEGDIHAQITANYLIEDRVLTMTAEYGLDDLVDLSRELNGRTEAAMRDAIRKVPDGVYDYKMLTDGLRAEAPFTFALRLTVKDDTIHFDFDGTSPVQPRSINCPFCYTYAMSAYAIKCALLPDVPNNSGMLRPITVTAPENTLLNPLPPASVGARASTGHYVPILAFGALAEVLPDRVMAAAGSPLWNCTQSGVRPNGQPYATNLFFNGGMGATLGSDGESAISWPSNLSCTPVEVAEQTAPLLFHYKRLRPNSGGEGQYRGGLGEDMLVESLSESPIAVTFMAERTRHAAPGLAGGGDGEVGAVEINGVEADNRAQHHLERGDRILIATPGGGGYGSPEARDEARIAEDLRQGYVRGDDR
ncbi:MAG: hydantoinase B/oxoprolinase family protein [Alphaproteobacteria bacterium]|nr:hydantoinase B/oxoprolinase family protein [Alphaproteobacteria bacterium]